MGTSPKAFLTAGHGGEDPGACAYGMKEKDINLQIMLACQEELVRHGVTVICSRVTDENDPVQQETQEANASKADIAVSFHTNAFRGEGSTADGSETYYYPGSVNGKRLAELCEKYVQETGQNSRRIRERGELYFLKNTVMPAVLCECGFIDCDKDNDIFDTVEEQKTFGKAYAKAILEYFGIDYIEPEPVLYRVQLGTYKTKEEAENVLSSLKEIVLSGTVVC